MMVGTASSKLSSQFSLPVQPGREFHVIRPDPASAHKLPNETHHGPDGKTPGRPATDRNRSAANQSPEQRQDLARLQARDREVRAHEAAHRSAAGRYGGAVSFEFAIGPDGRRYAVGGEVAIDASAIAGDPQSTIDKMEVIARAALAPANPSAQDRAVAAKAQRSAARARQELMMERSDDSNEPQKEPIDEMNPFSLTSSSTPGSLIDVVA